jgi:hypothetical protein
VIDLNLSRIARILVVMALFGACCFAQKVRADLVNENIVRSRLQAGRVDAGKRQAMIKALFGDAGCTAEEQPIDHHHGNVICTLPGKTDSTIIVGGHFDFAERGEGIVDDWSGTSLLPSLYEALKAEPRKHTYIFIAFADEEKGLLGSSWYVKHLTSYQRARIQAFVNLECLGLSEVRVWVHRSTPELVKEFARVANSLSLPVGEVDVERIGDDDTHPFQKAKIPVISVHSLTQENFRILHTINDTLEAVRFYEYYVAYKIVAVFLAALDQTAA